MKTKKIFIVDDNFFYCNILKKRLNETCDYEVEIFQSGQDCINNAHKQPDIIFLDYLLGDTDGFEVLKDIKSTYPHIQVVILSGQTKMKVAINALRFGATDYLIKETDDTPERLSQIIRDCERISGSLLNNNKTKRKKRFLPFF